MCNLKERPSQFCGIMVHQIYGSDIERLKTDKSTDETNAMYLDLLAQNLAIYDVSRETTVDKILEAMDYCRRKYGTDHLLIDNFSKLDVGYATLERQHEAINRLSDYARDHNVIIFLCHHARKTSEGGRERSGPPVSADVMGSSAIKNLANIAIACWRNRVKEKLLAEFPNGEGLEGKQLDAYLAKKDEPDEIISIANDRGDKHGRSSSHEFKLAFDQESLRFYPKDKPEKLRSYIETIKENLENFDGVMPEMEAMPEKTSPENAEARTEWQNPAKAVETQNDDEWTPED